MKGIVGIEAAIVLIAFVIVAAALAFVVLNMGMYTTQRSKDVMQQGLNEATSALEVDGNVLGYVDENANDTVTAIYIPLKISPGQQAVDFDPSKIDILVILPDGTYSKILPSTDAIVDIRDNTSIDYTDLLQQITVNSNTKVAGKVFILNGNNNNTVLEPGEKFLLVIKLNSSLGLSQYEKFTVEIRPLQGAPLTIERVIPPSLPEGQIITLG